MVGCVGQQSEPVVEEKKALPTLLVVQSVFNRGRDASGKATIETQPAVLSLWRTDGLRWTEEQVADPESNVFHKAMPYQDGILTIGAEGAHIKHWTAGDAGWNSETLWSRTWTGKYNRMRDLELGDLDGDGQDEMVVATHDVGVIAVGRFANEAWTFSEYGEKQDTFVHEIEMGDVDGDGVKEAYATPSERNRASGESQPGGVVQVTMKDGAAAIAPVVAWEATHAKEILVTDLGDGKDSLLAVKEASKTSPVQVVQLVPGPDGWTESVLAEVTGEKQARFLVPGDVDNDGQTELVLSGMNTGLWILKSNESGGYAATSIDTSSGGYEQAVHLADLDGKPGLEIYVASERPGKPRQLRRYVYNGTGYDMMPIQTIKGLGIIWNIQDGVF